MAARRGEPSGRCKACAHPERVRIELLLAGGASRRAVAAKYQLGHYALARHWRNHVSDERRTNLVLGPVQRASLAARVAEESESVIDHFKSVRAGLYGLYDAAVTAGDRIGGAMLAGRLHENLNSMARLTGQLATSPLVQFNQQNNFFSSDPAFAEFQARLIATLRPFPEARNAVISEFERVERAAPQLTHGAQVYDAA